MSRPKVAGISRAQTLSTASQDLSARSVAICGGVLPAASFHDLLVRRTKVRKKRLTIPQIIQSINEWFADDSGDARTMVVRAPDIRLVRDTRLAKQRSVAIVDRPVNAEIMGESGLRGVQPC